MFFVNRSINFFILRYVNPDPHCYKYTTYFQLWPDWDKVHMFLYSFIPASIMFTFNILLIYTTLLSKNSKMKESEKVAKKKTKLTISLLVITFCFIVLTLPSTIAWGYLPDYLYSFEYGALVLSTLDDFSFSNHASVFITSFVSNYKFRLVFINYLKMLFFGNHKNPIKQTRKSPGRLMGTY